MNTSVKDRQALEVAFFRDPADAEAFAALRKVYQAESDTEALANLFERRSNHLHDGQRASDLLWQAAEIHAQRENLPEETRVLQKIMERYRGHSRSLERLKAIYTAQEKTSELLYLLAREAEVIAESGGDPKRISHVEYEAGQLWETKFHRLDKAIVHYQRAFKANPNHTDSIDAGRQIYRSVGDWKTVASLYQVEVSTCIDTRRKVDLLTDLGRLQWEKLDDLEAAARYLSEASQLRPGDETLMETLGEIYASSQWPIPGGLDKAAAIFMQIAQRRHSNGDREGSISFLRRALGADPENETAYGRLEQAYEETGRWEDLERLFRQRISVATGMEATALLMRRGELLEQKLGDIKGARECYESVLVQEPLGGPASSRLVELYRAEEDWEKVIELKTRALEGSRDQQTRIQLMMDIATITRDHLNEAETAAHLFHEVLGLDPHHRKALAAYEDYFRQMGDYRNLAELLRFAAETASNSGAPPMEICARLEELADVTERRLGDLAGSLEAWQQLAMIHPDTQRSNESISRLGAKIKMWQGTIQLLERELSGAVTSGQRLETLRRMAQLYYEKKADPQRAIEILHQILESAPDDEHTLHILLDLYERESEYEGVALTLEHQLRGIMTKTERISSLRRLSEIYQDKLSKPKEALRALKALLEIVPNDLKVLESIQTLLTRAEDYGHLAQILEFRAQVSSELQDKIDALKSLARLMADRLDNPGGAAAYWEEIRVLDPNDEEALDALTAIYDQTGHPMELLEILKHRYSISEQAPLASKAKILRSLATFADQRLDNPEQAIFAYEQLAALLPADRDTLEALARFYGRLGRHADLAQILGRQIELADDPEQSVVLAFKQGDLLESQLSDPDGAALIFERIISHYSPGDLDAHRRLKHLYLRRGEFRRACEIAEREFFLTPPGSDDRRSLAVSIAKLWRETIKDDAQAALNYERVLELEPGRLDAMLTLRRIYHQLGAYTKLIKLGPQLLAHLDDDQEKCVLLLELAQVHEQQLKDPESAFDCYRQAYDQHPADRSSLEQMERMARQYNMWESLISTFLEARRQTRDPIKFRALTQQVVNICQVELDDSTRAFHILKQAIQPDQANETLLKDLEQLADAAGQIFELLEIYEQLIRSASDGQLKAQLLRHHARIAELKGNAAGRALDDLLQLFHITPEDRMVLVEIERLAAATQRWDDAIRVHGQRLAHAEDDESRLEILNHVASRLEAHVGDLTRAFRARLKFFSIRPEDRENTDHLWRLADLLHESFTREDTGESWSIVSQTEEIDAIMVTELDVIEEVLVIEPSKPSRGESTIDDPTLLELLPTDLPTSKAPPLPPPSPRRSVPPSRSINGASGLLPAHPKLSSPWEELALAHLSLPTPNPELRIRHLLGAAKVMADGAHEIDQAFDYLAEAASINIENARVQERLADLSIEPQNFTRLQQIYLDSLERTADASTLIWIHLRAAELLRDHGHQDSAEQHYIAIMAIQPDHPQAFELLRQLYQSGKRWADLALLIERQLDVLYNRLDTDQRARFLEEIADLYQYPLDRPFEAVDFLIRLLSEKRELRVMLRLADLYHDLSIWPKLIDLLKHLLEQEIDLSLRIEQTLRVAQIYDQELELPDRAIEYYQRVLGDQPSNEVALLALERLFGAHDRPEDQIEILKLHVDCSDPAAEKTHALLMRLAHALRNMARFEEAGEYLQQARMIKPRDPETGAALARVLVHSGHCEKAVTLLQEQLLDALEQGDSDDLAVAILIRQASILDKLLDDTTGARKAFEHALTLRPENIELLQSLGEFYLRREAWNDAVDIQQRLSSCSSDPLFKAHALLNAAHLASNKLDHHERAIALYEQVLSLDPTQAAAIDALLLHRELSPQRREELLRLKLESLDDDRERAATLTQLGCLLRESGAPNEEIQHILVEAFELDQYHTPAILVLAELHVSQGRIEPARLLLQETIDRLGKHREATILHFTLGQVLDQIGNTEDAYRHFMDALRFEPNNLQFRIAAGLNRHQAQRWREALRHLQEVIDAPPADNPEQIAHALFAAGQCEIQLNHPERSNPYFLRALEQNPHHLPSLNALAQDALQTSAWEQAADYLQRQLALAVTTNDQIRLLKSLGDITFKQLSDATTAVIYYQRLLDLIDDDEATQLELLPRILAVFQSAGQHLTAARTAESLARILSAEEELSMLLVAADERERSNDIETAEKHRREVLHRDPARLEALEGLSRTLEARGSYQEVVDILSGLIATPLMGADTLQGLAPAHLIARLGQALIKTGDHEGAITQLERSLELAENPALRDLLLPLYSESPAHQQAARLNHRLLLAQDISRVESLRALAEITYEEDPYRSYCYYQVLAALTTLSPEETALIANLTPRELPADAPFTGEISDPNFQALMMATEVHSLREVFALLWDIAPTLFSRDLQAYGVTPAHRVSPLADTDLARVFGACSKALGIKTTTMYAYEQADGSPIQLLGMVPPALLVSSLFAEEASLLELRFCVGRALELSQPSFILASGLSRTEFTRILSSMLKAFHPRYIRGRRNFSSEEMEEAARFRRSLPFKIARQLGDIFRNHVKTQFDSGLWRQAVHMSANRAGLVLCGDLDVALRIVINDDPTLAGKTIEEMLTFSPLVRDLLTFAASDECYTLRVKLGLNAQR